MFSDSSYITYIKDLELLLGAKTIMAFTTEKLLLLLLLF